MSAERLEANGVCFSSGACQRRGPRGRRAGSKPVYLRRLETVRNAEAWGSRAAGRPRLEGQVEPVAAALGRKTQRRGGRTRGVTSQGSLHWNLIFICPGFTLFFFLHIFKNRILSRFNLFLLPIPRLNRASRLGRLLLYSNHSGFWKPAERRKVAGAPERSRGRERERRGQRARAGEQATRGTGVK